jgi:hypothetical protein
MTSWSGHPTACRTRISVSRNGRDSVRASILPTVLLPHPAMPIRIIFDFERFTGRFSTKTGTVYSIM